MLRFGFNKCQMVVANNRIMKVMSRDIGGVLLDIHT